jgi:hypothetical protein
MLRTLGIIALGLALFIVIFSAFIALHVLTIRAWQFMAISASAFIASLVIAAVDPKHVWEHVPAVLVGGVVIFLLQGLKHFLDREPGLVLALAVAGFTSGLLGAWIGRWGRNW